MSIDQNPGKKPLVPAPPPPWGELAPEDKPAKVIRFVLADRVACYPTAELKRWEHAGGEPEVLTIKAGPDQVRVEGRELGVIRAALDGGLLLELRPTPGRGQAARPGPRVEQITLETA